MNGLSVPCFRLLTVVLVNVKLSGDDELNVCFIELTGVIYCIDFILRCNLNYGGGVVGTVIGD
jgi:hypothetical protein